jgi:hypothetical protein
MYTILNEEQGQGLWETLASMTYPQLFIVKLVEDCDSDLENSDDNEIISLLRSTAFSYLFFLLIFSKLLNKYNFTIF